MTSARSPRIVRGRTRLRGPYPPRERRWEVRNDDCLKTLPKLQADSIDAIVTDPPYGLEFMGKEWDSFRSDDPGTNRNRGEHSGLHGTADGTGEDDYPARGKIAVTYGGGKHPGTFRCTGCGKRDQFRNEHACRPSARWARELIDPFTAPPTMLAFENWCRDWALAAMRVLKPGGHLLAFGGTRTHHRLACGLEDAGFEIRDCLCWLYGQGFPKSLNVAVAIEKAEGCPPRGHAIPVASTQLPSGRYAKEKLYATPVEPYRACSKTAAAWQGWSTALKPGWEPIIVARKPLDGTVAQNVLEHGTGALNVDGCRIGFRCGADERSSKTKNRHADFRSKPRKNRIYGRDEHSRGNYDVPGRWPANVALSHTTDCQQVGHSRVRSNSHHPALRGKGGLGTTGHKGQQGLAERSSARELVDCWKCSPDCPVRMLDAHSSDIGNGWKRNNGESYAEEGRQYEGGCFSGCGFTGGSTYADTGGPSRFFYCAKASRAERDAGLDGSKKKSSQRLSDDQSPGTFQTKGTEKAVSNSHPTVKPLSLMRWLVRLVTPPGGTVLDPFAGSGSTGAAAVMEGARFLGIEREAAYVSIARARIKHWAKSTDRRSQ